MQTIISYITQKKAHRKAASLLTGSEMEELFGPEPDRHVHVPRKLGPRDIGRVRGYKGTKWDTKLFNSNFLEEKISYRSKSQEFYKRKQANPVKRGETVDEIGISTDFQKPEYCNDVLRDMKHTKVAWMVDKPMARRNVELEQLKGQKVTRACHISEIQTPVGWKPIDYIYKDDDKDFLAEHFWFAGSGVDFDFQKISQVISCLPPQKQLQLNKQPLPTGYESKLNWLKMLLNMVTEEMAIIRKEDDLYEYGRQMSMSMLMETENEHELEHELKLQNANANANENKNENENENENENGPIIEMLEDEEKDQEINIDKLEIKVELFKNEDDDENEDKDEDQDQEEAKANDNDNVGTLEWIKAD